MDEHVDEGERSFKTWIIYKTSPPPPLPLPQSFFCLHRVELLEHLLEPAALPLPLSGCHRLRLHQLPQESNLKVKPGQFPFLTSPSRQR